MERSGSSEFLQDRRPLVFISHSGRDTPIAQELARKIEARGARTFLDANNLVSGDVFSEVIRAALREADELVVLWTPWALERPYIAMEVGAAWVRGIRIVQILHELGAGELTQRPSFPDPIRQLQMIRLSDVDRYLDELEARIRAREAR